MKVGIPVITPEKKAHLKQLVERFFADKNNFRYEHSYIYGNFAAAAVAASHGSFDFALVLEHFDELTPAIEFFYGKKMEGLDWRDVLIYSTAYLFFDRPLFKFLNKNDLDKRIKGLYFLDNGTYGNPYAVNSTRSKKKYFLPKAELPEALQKSIRKNDAAALCKVPDAHGAETAAKTAYALLDAQNWELFAALYHHIDLLPLLDMESVYEFWCKKIVHDAVEGRAETRKAFLKQWEDLDRYPLHKLILDWDRTGRIVPVFFETGFLTPEIMNILLQREHSFDKPLAPYAGWEELTFRAFAETYGGLAKYMPKSVEHRVDCSDESILMNLKAAAQFNEFLLAHPQYGAGRKKSVAVPKKSKKTTGLTEAQKLRIAQDEHDGVEFGNNYRMLKNYGWRKESLTYEVPDMVTAIGVEAFVDCSDNLEHVILPEGVTRIGRNAFGWTEIRRIDLPETLVSIGEAAFVCCDKLKSIRIPDGVAELPCNALAYCKTLETVELPEGIRIHPDAFKDSPKVKIVYRPVRKKTK